MVFFVFFWLIFFLDVVVTSPLSVITNVNALQLPIFLASEIRKTDSDVIDLGGRRYTVGFFF